jgi:branched-chain amino acid transport system ATP-binding protein
MAEHYLNIQNLNVSYGSIQVLWNENMYVDKGEIVALVGSNGAGKSTTVKAIAGLVKRSSGSVTLNGEELPNGNCRGVIDKGIILCPEGRQLFPSMTVYENLEAGACTKEAQEKKAEMFDKVFTWFPKLKERRNQLAGTLSGGEQQMVALSRSMMGIPKVLMMDEPSLGLAPNIVDEIFNIAKTVSEKDGLTIILVEQDVRKALKIANRGYVVENGAINISGTSNELMNNPEVKKAYLGF